MKKYITIGHLENEEITSAAFAANTMKEFKQELKANGFTPWLVLTEKGFIDIINGADIFEIVKKKVSNFRRWDEITEYIEQCSDIMQIKLRMAE